MERFEREVANEQHVDHRIRRRFAALFAAGQLLLRYSIAPKKCDKFMDAISKCYRVAIRLQPKPLPSMEQLAHSLHDFLRQHKSEFLKRSKGFKPRDYSSALGFVTGKADDRKYEIKTAAIQRDELWDCFGSGKALLAASGILDNDGASIQKRIPGMRGLREYFYIVNGSKLKKAC